MMQRKRRPRAARARSAPGFGGGSPPSFTTARWLAAALGGLTISLVGCLSSPIPAVDIVSVSPEALDPADDAKDDLTFVLAYSDGDGDLGGGVVRVFDCRREGLVTDLPIPTIANEEAVRLGVSIEGELSVVLADVGVVTPGDAPSAACADLGAPASGAGAQAFCVVLIDIDGHESEGACTGPIAVE